MADIEPRAITTSQEVEAYWSRRLAAAAAPGPPTVVPDEGTTVGAGQSLARVLLSAGGLSGANVEMRIGGVVVMRFWVAGDATEVYETRLRLNDGAEFVKSNTAMFALLVIV